MAHVLASSLSGPEPGSRRLLGADLAFVLFAAIYAFLAITGIQDISAGGAHLDSDLQTYAQAMAGEHNPQFFKNDPVLSHSTAANSIPNLQRMLAEALTPGDNYAVGLLRAGAVAIFFFYTLWYGFGRWLYGKPSLAAILALLMGITVWVGWGTFWGITHSDPVPRVFFATLLPLILALGISAFTRPSLRPVAMFCAGIGMWIHGVNALNCGAMLFMAFLLFKPGKSTLRRHIINCGASLAAFLLPVGIYLWPSLKGAGNFDSDALAIFREYAAWRWHKDYTGFGRRILEFLSPGNPVAWLLATGAGCWVIAFIKGNFREKILCKMCAAFVPALVCVAAFCWAESHFSEAMERLAMGHELVRGLRFLVPMSWLMVVSAISCVAGQKMRVAILAVLIVSLALFTNDRQYEAAQYAVCRLTGLSTPLARKAQEEMAAATGYREMLATLESIVPPGEPIFSNTEDMAVRYIALRPLVHTFKDGYVFYYNKDISGARQWLNYEHLLNSGPRGFVHAWLESGAPWLLCRKSALSSGMEEYGSVVMEKNGWILLRKKEKP